MILGGFAIGANSEEWRLGFNTEVKSNGECKTTLTKENTIANGELKAILEAEGSQDKLKGVVGMEYKSKHVAVAASYDHSLNSSNAKGSMVVGYDGAYLGGSAETSFTDSTVKLEKVQATLTYESEKYDIGSS